MNCEIFSRTRRANSSSFALDFAGLSFDANLQRDLRKARAERDLGLIGFDQSRDRFVERRFAHPESLEDAHRVNLVGAAIRRDPRYHRIFHHRFHFARHARQHDQMRSVAIARHRHPEAGRGAERILDDGRALGKERLLEIVLGHRAVHRREQSFHVLDGRLVAPQLHARDARNRFGGQVVGGRADAAGRNDDIAFLDRRAPRPFEAVGNVADREHRNQVDSNFRELVGQIVGVGIDHLAGGDFVAGGKNHSVLNHRELLAGVQVQSRRTNHLQYNIRIDRRSQIVEHDARAVAHAAIDQVRRPRFDHVGDSKQQESEHQPAERDRIAEHRRRHAEHFIDNDARVVVIVENFLGAIGNPARNRKRDREDDQA